MTTDDKTPDSLTPALLSAARLAEIRERVAAGKFEHTMSDRAALLAHLDALTGPLPDDGGEALPALEPQHTPTAERFDGEVWRGRVKVDDDWAHVAVRTIDGATVPMFYWHGKWRGVAEGFGYEVMSAWALAQRAAGRSEGEAERAALDAEIAFLISERNALAKRLDLSPAEVVTLAAWEEEKAKSARLTAERDAAREEIAILRREAQSACNGMDHLQDKIDALTAELAEARAGIEPRHALSADNYPLCGTSTALYVTRQAEAVTCPVCARLDGAREERRLSNAVLMMLRQHVNTRAGKRVLEQALLDADSRARGEGQGS